MTEPLETLFPTVTDNTIISSWRSCKHKCYRQHFQGLHSIAISVHLHFGGAFAHGIEMARRVAYAPGVTKETLPANWLDEPIRAIIDYWGDYVPPTTSTGAEHSKNLKSCISALEDYFQTYPPFEDSVQPLRKEDGTPFVEFTFGIPLPINHPVTGDPILYGGRFDMFGHYSSMNVKAVIDEKTTTSLSSTWAEKWNMSGQFIGYIWALQQLGYDVDLVIVRGIAILKRQFKHAEAHIIVPSFLIENWYSAMIETVQEMAEVYKDSELGAVPLYSQNFGEACTAFNSLCDSFKLCTSKHPDSWLDAYTVRRWNPLSKDNTRKEEENV